MSAAVSMRFAGCIPGDDRSPRFPSVKLLNSRSGRSGPPRVRLATSDLSAYVLMARDVGAAAGEDPIYDQGGSGSCTSQAFPMGVRTRLFYLACNSGLSEDEKAAVLATIDAPAVLPLYQGARRVTGAPRTLDGTGGSQDVGTQIAAVFDFATRVGTPREHDGHVGARFSEYRVTENVLDDVAVLHAAYDNRLVTEVHALDGETPEEIEEEIDTCLSMGEPVEYGTPVDYPFTQLGAHTEPVERTHPRIGYHAMLIVGHGPGYYLVCNSWGSGWGNGGFVKVKKSWVISESFDRHRFDVVPPFGR